MTLRFLFLCLVCLSLGCSPREEPQPVQIEDPDRDLFLAEIDEYFVLHADRFDQHNAAEGLRRFERLSVLLYEAKDAWEWLEIVEPEWRWVGLKPGVTLEDLPLEIQSRLQSFLDWDPFGEVEQGPEVGSVGSCFNEDYLEVLLDLLGGDHPFWEQTLHLVELSQKDFGVIQYVAHRALLRLTLRRPDAFPDSWVQRLKSSALNRSAVLGFALATRREYEAASMEPTNAMLHARAEVRFMMSLDLEEEIPLNHPRIERWMISQAELEELAAQLP